VGVIVDGTPQPLVAHAAPAESPGARAVSKLEPLSVFLQAGRASRAAVYRLDPARLGNAAERARQAAAAARALAERALPFDFRFDLATPETLYCSELVLRAYAQAGVDLQVRASAHIPFLPHAVLLPDDLTHSPLLRRVDPPD
jgi:hypothetical protein